MWNYLLCLLTCYVFKAFCFLKIWNSSVCLSIKKKWNLKKDIKNHLGPNTLWKISLLFCTCRLVNLACRSSVVHITYKEPFAGQTIIWYTLLVLKLWGSKVTGQGSNCSRHLLVDRVFSNQYLENPSLDRHQTWYIYRCL